ncbi:MAG TPA: precorrin-3B C(17)-methyltransferase [Trebonia sp.]|jgi:cobalt-precorrin 5A hydrolase/precorrin-3B C17-methyltransferase|nr:precorrin-3B C(17)-methyltransferase [Trebonia sp.]
MIGLIAVTAAGRAAAARLAAAWPGQTRAYESPAARSLPQAWAECDGLVCFLACGAVIRLIAPLLDGKHTDPAVVCVDEAARFAVPLAGGHAGGANALAARAAAVLGAEPVITTASDAAGLPGLDDLGWPAEGAIAAVTRALLDGGTVVLDGDETWPLPPLPVIRAGQGAAADPAGYRILVTDRVVPADPRTVVLRPPSLVAGIGASRNVRCAEVLGLVDEALAAAGLSPASVTALATVDAKAAEPGLVAAARQRGWPLLAYPAARLAAVPVPNPGEAALAAVGTPSVAEAAALASADTLVVQKRKSAMATVAIARVRPRGRLAVIGLGPGARDLLPPRAVAELRRASVIVGLGRYVDQIRDLLRPGTEVAASGPGAEEERARTAVARARQGHAVALVGSGDAGVYAMASPALQQAGDDIDVTVVPGVTASLAAAALLGAPLGHDHAVISLSDLHTPWEVIERRVRAAAEADYVTVFYNPRSQGRHWQLGAALAVLAARRPPATPAAVVRNASRPGQRVVLTTLAEFDPRAADMLSVVIVGASTTRVIAGRMVTPRGYSWQPR